MLPATSPQFIHLESACTRHKNKRYTDRLKNTRKLHISFSFSFSFSFGFSFSFRLCFSTCLLPHPLPLPSTAIYSTTDATFRPLCYRPADPIPTTMYIYGYTYICICRCIWICIFVRVCWCVCGAFVGLVNFNFYNWFLRIASVIGIWNERIYICIWMWLKIKIRSGCLEEHNQRSFIGFSKPE